MKNTILELAGSLSALFQNTHINVSLDGWPAAVAIIAISISGVTAYAIKVLSSEVVKAAPEMQQPYMAA